MKAYLEGFYCYFFDVDAREKQWLKSMLTWMPKHEHESKVCLLFQTTQGHLCTYHGLLGVIKERFPEPIETHIANPQDFRRLEIKSVGLSDIELYQFQLKAIEKAASLKFGIVESPTGSGKTIIMLGLIRCLIDSNRMNRALIVVPNTQIASTIHIKARELGFSSDEVGVVDQSRKDYHARVIICVVNSVDQNIKSQYNTAFNQILSEVDALFYDEVHHFQADTYKQIPFAVSGKLNYLIGFTGTAFKDSKNVLAHSEDARLVGLLGEPIFKISDKFLADHGIIAEAYTFIQTVEGKMQSFYGQYNTIYNNFIVKSQKRNRLIQYWAEQFVRNNHKVLILIQRKDHAKYLMHRLSNYNVLSIFGSKKSLQFDESGNIQEWFVSYDQIRDEFEQGVWDILIGSQVLDEGFDIPSIGGFILAGGGKSRIATRQRYGRSRRAKTHGPNRVYIVDFWDKGHVFLYSHSKKRLQYLKEDIQANIIEDPLEFINYLEKHHANA